MLSENAEDEENKEQKCLESGRIPILGHRSFNRALFEDVGGEVSHPALLELCRRDAITGTIDMTILNCKILLVFFLAAHFLSGSSISGELRFTEVF